MKTTIRSLVTRSLLAAAAIPLLATGLKAQLPTPLINIDASALDEGAVAAPLTNTGTLGGNFATDGTTVNVATTSGKKSFTFDGGNRLKASFTSPAAIAGNGTYTVVATVLNPAIAGEEAYLSWSRRFPAGGFNAAQFNYGSNPDYGAVTHWTWPDMGFSSVPPANLWHTIAVTYDGTTEKIYVNGALSAQENKTLNMYEGDPIFVGCSFNYLGAEGALQTELGFTGSLASVQVYGAALSEAQVKEASGAVLVTGQVTTGGEPLAGVTVSYGPSANPGANPSGTAITDASGNYTIGVPQNTGTIYLAASKANYLTSPDSAPQTVGTSDISGINFALDLAPPLIDLDASALTDGALATWTNAGSLAGSFGNDGTTVNVETVGGKKAVTFDGTNRMKADFTAPAAITGNGSYTVVALLYNPLVGDEEAYLTWAQRDWTVAGRTAQFNFGSNSGYGAVTHFYAPDMGFPTPPPASLWTALAVTFDGATEKIYLNGVLKDQENKTLNLYAGQPVMLGTSYWAADGTSPAIGFTGSMATLKVYSGALTSAQINALLGTVFISGNITSGGNPVSGATVYYKLSPGATNSPLGTVTTDANGDYTIGVLPNSGTYYIAAGKTGYISSADYSPAPTVASANITGINLDIEAMPAISGNVWNGNDSLYNAAVTVNTSPDGGTTLVPVQTVYTDTFGNYLAYVTKNTTYYLTVRKSVHDDADPATVVVTTLDEAQDFTLTKLPRVLLVDLKAADLPSGVQTTATTWTNTGLLGGTFTANNPYSVANVAGRPAVDFTVTPDVTFTSSWQTDAVTWPSALAGTGDVQYSVVAWIQAPASTGTFVSWSLGNAPANGRTFSPSWMTFRYNNSVAWGAGDHGLSHWIGWTGTNTNSSTTDFPPLGTWHMIVHTYDGRSEALFVDNVRKSTAGSEAILRTFNPEVGAMRIGNHRDGWDAFKGYIHRVQVFDQALSDADVTQLWNDGAVTGTSYDTWLAAYPSLTGTDRAPDADPDFDGVSNGIEFLLGTVPNDGSSRAMPSITRDGSGNLVVTFKRSVAAEDFPVVVEHSENLLPPWTEIAVPVDAITGPPVTVVDNGASPDDITVLVPGAPAQKKFARVKIVIPFTL